MTNHGQDRARRGVPKVVGHRGAAGLAPENTLASIRAAAALGVRWVEFDVKLSRDGQVILFHDDTLERTTNGSGLVEDALMAHLETLDAGGWFGSGFQGEPIPTLPQALDVLRECGLGAIVEIKPSRGREVETARAAAAVLDDLWPKGLPPPLLSSFKDSVLTAARDAAPHIPRALNVLDVPADWRTRLVETDCVAFHCLHDRLKRPQVEAVREAGYGVRCFTVNDRKRAETLYIWGVETVITDRPDRLL